MALHHIGTTSHDPYEVFSNAWRTVAPALSWLFHIKLSGTDAKNYIEADKDSIRIFDQSVQFRAKIDRDINIVLPFEITVFVKDSSARKPEFIAVHSTEKIWGPRGRGFQWTDMTARLKLKVEALSSITNATHTIRGITAQIHGQRVIEELHLIQRPTPYAHLEQPTNPWYGLEEYTCHLALRLEDKILWSDCFRKIRITHTESPFDNTVAISFPSPVTLQCPIVHPSDPDQLRLVADVMLFDVKGKLFWYRSAYLWLQTHRLFPAFCEASMLSQDAFWLMFAFEKLDKESTYVREIRLILPLAHINRWFKTHIKLVDVSELLLDPVGDREKPNTTGPKHRSGA